MTDASEYARERLLDFMRDLSERCYCAGWMLGLEAALWDLMLKGGGAYGMSDVAAGEAAKLQRLATDAGWWWMYGGAGPEFGALDAWVNVHRKAWTPG